jgi:outer membrane protein insertion porin family
VDVRKDSQKLSLSPVIVAILAISAPLSLSQPSYGENLEAQTTTAQASSAISSSQRDKPSNLPPDAIAIPVTLNSQAQPPSTNLPEVIPTVSTSQVNSDHQEIGVELMPQSLPQPVAELPVSEVSVNPSSELSNTEQSDPSKFSFLALEPNTQASSAPVSSDLTAQADSQPQTQPENQTDTTEPRVLVAEIVVTQKSGELDPQFETLVLDTIKTRPGLETTRSQLQSDVNAVYETGLFADVTVIPEDTELGVRITFQVQPNPILTRVEVEHLPATPETSVLPDSVIQEIFGDNYGKILNLRELQTDIKALNDWYTEQGYDLAQVVDAPNISPDGVVTLIVAEGVVEDIKVRFFNENQEEVEGRTREFIVTREVELKPGDVFNRNMAQKDLQRVFGLGLFDDVRLSFSPGQDPSKVVVNVDVVEGNTGSLAAGAGISSASGLFGTVSYQQKNLGGNNQTLGAEIQLGTREFLFDASFTDPWIAGDPYRTSYTVDFFRRRSISYIFDGGNPEINLGNGDRPRIIRTGGGLSFSRPFPANPYEKADWRFSTGLEYQRVEITDADGNTSPVDANGNQLSFSGDGIDDLITLQFGASRDRRNDPLQPTSGSLLRLGIEQTIPFGSGSILFNRIRGSYSYYMPVNYLNFSEGAQALAFNVQAGTIIGDLPPYEAFSLGGSNSIRGYDEGEVGSGRSYLQATAEYRFPLFSVIGGALFLDYGTDLGTGDNVPGNPAGVRNKPGSAFGYGLGVRIQSPLGPIRVDYALNEDGDSRVHFGIGERF